MSDRRHPYTPMKQTSYGYVSKEEIKIDKQLDRDLKRRLRKEGAFNLHKKPSRSWEKEVGKSFERKIPLPNLFYHKSGGIID